MFSPHGVTIPILQDIKSQAPQAICEVAPTNVNRTLIINREKPPFDNTELRRAMSLTLDRKAFVDIITEGQGDIGGTMLPAPEGVWSMPPEILKTLPGYDPDVARTVPRPATSCRSSATVRTSGSRSRCRPATSRRIAIRR